MRMRIPMPSLIHGVSQLTAVERQPVHASVCDNTWPSITHGDQKRPPLIHVAKVFDGDFGSCYFHPINRGEDSQYISLFKLFDSGAVTGEGSGLIFDLSGNVLPIKDAALAYPNNDSAFEYLGSTDASAIAAPHQNIRALSVLDYTFIVNRDKACTLAGTPISATSPKGLAFVFIRQGAYGMQYRITFKIGSTTYTVKADVVTVTGNVTLFGDEVPDPIQPGRGTVKTQDIANYLVTKLNALAGTPVTATAFGSVIMVDIVAANTDFVNFSVTTSQGDGMGIGFWNESDSFNNLPLVCKDQYVVKIRGNSAGAEDDYWVIFVADEAGAFGKGHWEETVAPNTPLALSASTNPHALIRRTDDGLGTVTGTPDQEYFTFEPIAWTEREVGDEESNPSPSFISVDSTGGGAVGDSFTIARKISDASFYRDRLAFVAGENISLSEQGSYFGYFRTTVREVPDTDPIDAALSADRATAIHALVPFNGRLVLFSEEAQYALDGSPTLTPSTVEARLVSRYQNSQGCRPVAAAAGVLFAYPQGNFVSLKQLAPSRQVENQYKAEDLSTHTPKYIPGEARRIACTTDSSVVAVLSDDDLSYLYILREHVENDTKLQSAWVRFQFEGAEILGMEFFDTRLYLVCQRSDGVYLEYLELSPGVEDAGRSHWTYLDRRVDTPSISVLAGVSTITMPYPIEAGAVMEVVDENLVRHVGHTISGSTFKVNTNLTGLDFLAGRKYTSTHSFHRPQVAIDQGDGRKLILDSTSAVVALEVRYEKTAYFRTVVGTDPKETGSSTTAAGFETSTTSNGVETVGVGERLDSPFVVSIINDSPFPHNLVSAEWILNATIRS